MFIRILSSLSFCIFFASCAATQNTIQNNSAVRAGVPSIEKIIEKNHIAKPGNLRAGQLVIIPGTEYEKVNADFFWPINGKIVSFYGENTDSIKNKGLKIKTTSQANVKAARDGEVIFSNYLKGWGKTIILKHNGNFYTVYANLIDTATKEGSSVKRGEVVGKLALNKKNGEDTLYFEIRRGCLPQDPMKYLR